MMLGLRASPKDDSGFSPAEAVFGSTLSLPGKFLEHSEIPSEIFLHQVEQAVLGFSRPPQHHVVPQHQPLPQALLDMKFFFVYNDASSLLCLHFTEDLIECSDSRRNFCSPDWR